MQNKQFILHPHDETNATRKMYNFPLPGGFDDEDIRKQMTTIFKRQANSYKLNLSAGIILEHIVDEKYRYFVPGSNMYLLDTALTITNLKSLEAAIRDLQKQNLEETIKLFRPNSGYRLRFITQLKYYIYLTEYPLGNGTTLPDFILKNKHVITFKEQQKNKTGITNKLCFFTALAQKLNMEEGKRTNRVEKREVFLFKKWIWFLFSQKKFEFNKCEVSEFKGVELEQFPLLEDCFKRNIILFELKPDKSAITRYISTNLYEKDLYLNLWTDHINLISDHKKFTKSYQCGSCQKIFNRPYLLRRHTRGDCMNKTKYIFPGGYYSYYETIFQELDEVGVFVKPEQRFYPFFLVWDMECVLLPNQHNTEKKNTTFTHTHKPICCSVASNIPGFTEPQAILEFEQDLLVRKMLAYFLKIRSAAMILINERWGYVIKTLEQKIEIRQEYLVGEKIETDLYLKQLCSLKCKFTRYMEQFICLGFNSGRYDMNLIRQEICKYIFISSPLSTLNETEQLTNSTPQPNSAQAEDQTVLIENNDISNGGWSEQSSEGTLNIVERDEVGEQWTGRDYSRIERSITTEEERLECTESGEEGGEEEEGEEEEWKEGEGEGEKNENRRNGGGVQKEIEESGVQDVLGGEGGVESGGKGKRVKGKGGGKGKEKSSCTILKRGNNYLCISNEQFKMLDICNYLPPCTNYRKFLKAYEIAMEKFFFPYEYLDNVKRLSDKTLPPYPSEAWYSTLKDVDLLNEEFEEWERGGSKGERPLTGVENYENIVNMWEEKGWETLADLLMYYNNMDCLPFVKAVEKMMEQYKIKEIDLFKVSVSVPGVARILMMRNAQEQGLRFSLINEANKDLYFLFKNQIVAGPSIVFCRKQVKGETELRRGEGKLCKKIVGFDVNSLYLNAIESEMPCSDFIRRRREDNFKPSFKTIYSAMYVWMDYMSKKDGVKIRSGLTSGKECRVGPYYLDGLALFPQDLKVHLYEYNGCKFHPHDGCPLSITDSEELKLARKERTELKLKYLTDCGYVLHSIQECEFKLILNKEPHLQTAVDSFKPEFYKKHTSSLTEDEIKKGIISGELFGFAVVDIKVPESLHEQYEDFPPLFANHTVLRTDVGKCVDILC